jgi:hypothetical protein
LSRRAITLVLSLFVLAVLPLISLYYSFQGASLRKHAMSELGPKENIPENIAAVLKPGANLYVLTSGCMDTTILKPLINQFKDEKIRFAFVGDSSYQSQIVSFNIYPSKIEGLVQCIPMTANALIPVSGPCDIILTNSHFQILHRYDLSKATERTKIIEHIALLVTKK